MLLPWNSSPGYSLETTMLIGRDGELEELGHRVNAALRGRGALVLVSGGAGIGKTSFALAVGQRAEGVGATFGVGRCYEGKREPAFAPWPDLLADLQASTLLNFSALPQPFGDGPAAHTAYHLMRSVADLLGSAAAVAPLVLLLDDLQWADPDSLELLEFVTRRLQNLPLVVVATYRPEDVHPYHPLHEVLPRLWRDRPVEHIRLDPLGQAETCLLVEANQDRCSAELAAYLHTRADGNPFYVLEFLRELVERRLLPRDGEGRLLPPAQDVEVPLVLQQIVTRRLERLGAEAGQLLKAAAIVGQEWELAVVEEVLGWPEERLLHALEDVLTAKLVVPSAGQWETYRFGHGLIHEVLYAGQVERRRKRLHGLVGTALERLTRADGHPAANPAALAYHFRLAEVWQKTVEYSLRAGEAADDHNAAHSALLHYEQALAALQKAPVEVVPDTSIRLHEQLAQAHLVLSQYGEAQTAFSRMLELARGCGDGLAEGRALVGLSLIGRRLHLPDPAGSTAAAAVEVANRVQNPQLLSLAHWNLGHMYLSGGKWDVAYQHLGMGEQLARDAGEQEVRARCLQNLASMENWSGRYAQAQRLADEALTLARESRAAPTLMAACLALGIAHGELGHYERARQALQVGLEQAAELAESHYMAKLLNTMGWLHGELGDTEVARGWNEQALQVSRRARQDQVTEPERYSLLNLATDELQAGRLDLAEEYVREFERMLDGSDYNRHRYINRYHLLKAEVALMRGDSDAAASYAEEAKRLAEAKGMRKNLAKSLILQGRALLAQGRYPEAALRLQAGVGLADELEHGSLRWQGRLWLGRAHAVLRQLTIAADLYRQALDQVTSIAARLEDERQAASFLSSRLVQELRREAAGVEAPVTRALYPAGLTTREVEVLRLVAQGRTNPAIADAMCLSTRTINAHMSSILSKTGCANRAAAAIFAERHGLV